MACARSIGLDGMNAIKNVVAGICDALTTRVTIAETGTLKFKYDVKVYFDSTEEALRVLPRLTTDAILATLQAQQVQVTYCTHK
jgi:hypothetical protein